MDGILLVDKPRGVTSHDVVRDLRRLFGESRIGHCGTLDPMATGLLVVVLGKATKFVPYLIEHDKTYEAEITLGVTTDTDDAEGRVLRETDASGLTDVAIDLALERFHGPLAQVPPAYAAIKVDGRKLYDYARSGTTPPPIAPRAVTVHAITRTGPVLRESGRAVFPLTLQVSSGTYVRSIARDLGILLGNVGMLSALRRVRVDRFDVRDALTMDRIRLDTPLIDPVDALRLPRVILDDESSFKAMNGAFLSYSMFPSPVLSAVVDATGRILAVYEPDVVRGVMRLAVML